MRSHADPQGPATRGARWRVPLEWILRLLAIGSIALGLWRSLTPEAPARTASVEARDLAERLPALSRDPALQRLHLALDSTPSPWVRDWLAGFARAGVTVSWTGEPAPVAVSVEPVAEPAGGVRFSVAAANGARIALGDGASALDSVTMSGMGASTTLANLVGSGFASAGGQRASTMATDTARVGAVVVFGRPSWETRFVVTALEEAGWRVFSRVPVAPGAVMAASATPPLDTARVSAVVALDSTAAPFAAELARYVRSGGGLVMQTPGLAVRALAALAPARAGGELESSTSDTATLMTLGGRSLTSLADDAVPLASRGRTVTAAVHRVRRGRVMLLGVRESWRWRLAGGDDAVAAHRAWWTSNVAAVAHAPVVSVAERRTSGEDAPLAALVAALGPASTAPAEPSKGGEWPFRTLLLPALILLLLLATWWSRRLRGAP